MFIFCSSQAILN